MENEKKIRVLVVDDSIMARKILIEGLSRDPRLEVVGYAINSMDAARKIPALRPDVLTLDVEMPGQNGLDFLKELIPRNPLPVVLCSSLNLRVFDALSAGAVDFVRKPDMSRPESLDLFQRELALKVRAASRARVRMPGVSQAVHRAHPSPILPPLTSPSLDQVIIALGASTGGTEATLEVLRHLPANTPGMVIVQHMPVGFTDMYAQRLNRICKMEVREAKNGDRIERGVALIAPGDMQMKVVRTGMHYTVSCLNSPKVSGHRPSVDVLFDSMAQAVKCHQIGIILTGMGRDGANGMLKMRQAGAFTIGQDEATSVVYGMPMEAFKLGAVCKQAPIENIADVLLRHLNTL
nr:chemotaxis response regulator protein-glutamate methylesterase [uncultured Butyricicoccus sp.]